MSTLAIAHRMRPPRTQIQIARRLHEGHLRSAGAVRLHSARAANGKQFLKEAAELARPVDKVNLKNPVPRPPVGERLFLRVRLHLLR